ncbi:hypothetical protein [Bradyrhizobium sp. G127]|uniref:hypothetical protein n=1 Tax=Bradyrhizobium sp. G127 TaxID=2904800 RepID=UPI001F2C1977|nr:hypothetical protein [Bradyrhizobium sp. G127]MCF2523905.1 hypothetical protein [Bradyrhizobium sp. G127]
MTNRTEYLLSKLRAASLHTRLMASEIDSIGVALKGGFISDETAVEWAHDIGGPHVFGTVPPIIDQPHLEAAE